MKTIIRKFDTRKFRLAMCKLTIAACTLAMMCSTGMAAFAAGEPTEDDKTVMRSLMNLVFWIVRVAILMIGGVPSLLQIVRGQSSDEERDTKKGIVGLVITGACFAGTFVISSLINNNT